VDTNFLKSLEILNVINGISELVICHLFMEIRLFLNLWNPLVSKCDETLTKMWMEGTIMVKIKFDNF